MSRPEPTPLRSLGRVTSYAGVVFRSRTEARWAVFLDRMAIPWRFEPQVYDLYPCDADDHEPPCRYLPDFYLPSLREHLEIKGSPGTPTDDAMLRLHRFQHQVGPITLLAGCPGLPYEGVIDGDQHYRWAYCDFCGAVGLVYEGRCDRLRHAPRCPQAMMRQAPSRHLDQAYGIARRYEFVRGAA